MRGTKMFRVRVLEEVASTNEEVKRALEEGEAEGLVMRGLRQTGGYGRQGRTWASPEGGLYCSLLLRPHVAPAALPTLSLLVGIAVRRAIITLAGDSAAKTVHIKWPNDVVVTSCHPDEVRLPLCHPERSAQRGVEGSRMAPAVNRSVDTSRDPSTPHLRCSAQDDNGQHASYAKLCGISCEAHGGGVCVGVGVNVVPPAERPQVSGKNEPAYVADLASTPVTAERTLDAFLEAFAPLYEQWQHDGFAPFLEEYNAHASLTGQNVTIVDREGSLLAAGTVTRIDPHGRLILRTPTDNELPISSGEAHIR